MKTERAPRFVLSRSGLAAAIALLLSGPLYAEGTTAATSQYGWAVTYAVYCDQQSRYQSRAGDFIGRDVHSDGHDAIGRIDSLMVAADGDEIMAVISLGSYYHRGSKLVAIPYQDLRVTKDGKHVYYKATKEDMEGRSEFTYANGGHQVSSPEQ